jgi:peptidoglycan/xylan/chitin deacetylase (PgdA/CDA1 family)
MTVDQQLTLDLAPSFLDMELLPNILKRCKSYLLMPVGTVTGMFDVRDAIALTFDDGPDKDVTPAVLDVLARHGAKATFFVLTEKAVIHRELLKRIVEEGHELALHFDRHDRITQLRPLIALRRLYEARQQLAMMTGPVSLFRPPYGSQNYLTYLFARLLGLRVIGWKQCANDWLDQPVERAVRSASEGLSGGDIVLMHDGTPSDEPRPALDRPRVVDLFLQEAALRRLKAVTVGTLLKRRSPRRRSHWFR